MTTLLTMKGFNKKIDYLCFTANTANSAVALNKTGSPTAVTLETSTDGINWSTYTIWNTITLSNIGDKVYWRNTSETTTQFGIGTSGRYTFNLTWSINASWDVTSLINKNCTDTISWDFCFYRLFQDNAALKTTPELLATTLTPYCYNMMFYGCTWLTTPPELPATTLTNYCYQNMFCGCSNLEKLPRLRSTAVKQSSYSLMFKSCSKIKMSRSQTWEYQTPYRLPTEWTGTAWSGALINMFQYTWWTFTWTPSINTTYYTSNTLV